MKIGIIREGKVPPDSRVPLTPDQCAYLMDKFPIKIQIQASPNRCYSDEEYREAGIQLSEDLSGCSILMGIKEVPIDQLIPHKIYFFFSHTFKKQVYNRPLLQAILQKHIHLIDYEALTNDKGQRLIAFGHFAGMVGAHNGLLTYGLRTGGYQIPRMKDFRDYAEAKAFYSQNHLPQMKIVLTGGGRVAGGAALVLEDMGIKKVAPADFLQNNYSEAVFTQLDCKDYVERIDGSTFDTPDFYAHPHLYKSSFAPFAAAADVFINGIYWDNRAPAFFTVEEMRQPTFNIKVIADVTCDIAPVASIPSTLRASTIADPVFGFDPVTGQETAPFGNHSIDMMTIDNLPNEMPRDASQSFGEQFIASIIEELLEIEHSSVLQRASIALGGKLGKHFTYLDDFVKEVV